MLCRCYLKLGHWKEEVIELNEYSILNILEHYSTATTYDSACYKGWHKWAYMNYKTILFYKYQQSMTQSNEQTTEKGICVKANSEVIRLICFWL